ncbi:MAG TPA: hypothetical protein DCP62_00065 [Erysipelotrichaceae bacterium]|nr:hypothetical protein [Erysipelotrichaceae bacterium]
MKPLPNFIILSQNHDRYEVLRYTDYGKIALLKGRDEVSPFVLATELHVLPNGSYAWNSKISFSEQRMAVREFENEARIFRENNQGDKNEKSKFVR